MQDPKITINDYVTDMMAVEKHILEAVERQLGNENIAKYPDARQTLSTLKTTLQRHVDGFGRFVEAREDGDLKETLKNALTGALGIAAGIYDKIRSTDKVSRMVRDTYTATGLAVISYHMLYTTALGLKNDAVAEMALTNLKDLTPLQVELSKDVCRVVAQELAEEDKVFDGTVGDQAVSKTQEAWSGGHVETGATA